MNHRPAKTASFAATEFIGISAGILYYALLAIALICLWKTNGYFYFAVLALPSLVIAESILILLVLVTALLVFKKRTSKTKLIRLWVPALSAWGIALLIGWLATLYSEMPVEPKVLLDRNGFKIIRDDDGQGDQGVVRFAYKSHAYSAEEVSELLFERGSPCASEAFQVSDLVLLRDNAVLAIFYNGQHVCEEKNILARIDIADGGLRVQRIPLIETQGGKIDDRAYFLRIKEGEPIVEHDRKAGRPEQWSDESNRWVLVTQDANDKADWHVVGIDLTTLKQHDWLQGDVILLDEQHGIVLQRSRDYANNSHMTFRALRMTNDEIVDQIDLSFEQYRLTSQETQDGAANELEQLKYRAQIQRSSAVEAGTSVPAENENSTPFDGNFNRDDLEGMALAASNLAVRDLLMSDATIVRWNDSTRRLVMTLPSGMRRISPVTRRVIQQ